MHLRSFTTGILLCLVVALQGQSQLVRNFYKDIQLFGGVGTTSYFGDVGGKDSKIVGARAVFDNLDIDLWQVRSMVTAGIRINPFKNTAFTFQLSPVYLSGNDQRSNYESRGYSFNTWVVEGSFLMEFYFADRITGLAPYAIAGGSAMVYSFKNNSMIERSKWYTGNSVIFGLGTRFPSKTRFIHSLDASFHFTTTDFLDGMNSAKNSKDIFFVLCYKVHFQLYTSWYYDHKGLIR
jgi:hypothetical protein